MQPRNLCFPCVLIALFALRATTAHAATIQFAATNYTSIEGEAVRLILVIDASLRNPASVRIVGAGGSAGMSEYQLRNSGGVIQLGASREIGLWVDLTDDGLPELDETIEFTLADPTGGVVLGEAQKATVTIKNAGPRIEYFSGSCDETDGTYVANVVRRGDTNVAFSVDLVTLTNGFAVPGVNFMPTNGTLSVAAGERWLDFTIPILNDGVVAAGIQSFSFYLTNATAGVTLDPTPVEVTILDVQSPTTLDLSYVPPVRIENLHNHLVVSAGQIALLEWGPHIDNHVVFRIVRLNADGSLAGRSAPIFSDDSFVHLTAVQPDGKVLVRGNFSMINGVAVPRAGYARLHADGSLDMGFVPAIGWDQAEPLSDGRILVSAGESLRRLQADGALDPSFRAPGPVRLQSWAATEHGKSIVAGKFYEESPDHITILRLNPDGSPDSAFTPVTIPWDEWPYILRPLRLLIQPDGGIVILSVSLSFNAEEKRYGTSLTLSRVLADGGWDRSFDAGPPFFVPSGREYQPETSFILDGEKILLVHPHPHAGSVRRLNADGSYDRQFPVRFGSSSAHPLAVRNGRLLLAGDFREVNGFPGPGLARVLLDDAPESAAAIIPYGDPFLLFSGQDSWGWQGVGHEDMGDAEVTVRRLGDVRGPATVAYRTQDGTAGAGQDYAPVNGTLSFTPLATEQTFRLPLLDDSESEPDETLELVLGPATGVATIEPPTRFTIHDDEVTIAEFRKETRSDGDHVSFTFNSVPDQTYVIEESTDLQRWDEAGSIRTLTFSTRDRSVYSSSWAAGGLPVGAQKRFLRVRREFQPVPP